MEILYLLIPLSLGLVAFALWSFVWSVNNRQFDDLERHGWSPLFDDEEDKKP
ncbi:MAG TPA: cbb3-type cytochrome oxidase assembly protein CcoS [Pseudohongiella sp.]|nr:cbb3-type cytochrome oxidase assembly protein CcoS [Pseudohongiella sp.]